MEKNTWKKTFDLRTRGKETRSRETVVMPAKRAKGSVGEGESGKKAKTTQLVKSDLWGSLLDTTLIDVMWAKQAP